MGKKSRSGSGMNIPNHISEILDTIFWVKILKFFDADADPGIFSTLDLGLLPRKKWSEKRLVTTVKN
jgi:hypothetical protein